VIADIAEVAVRGRTPSLEDSARSAIDRATQAAWTTQQADGHWDFPADVGASSTAVAVIALAACGALEPEVAQELARGIAARQLADGGFQRFTHGHGGYAPTTALAAAALDIAGGPGRRDASARAWAFVERNGGIPAIAQALPRGELAIAFLVAAKRAAPEMVRYPGVELFAVPGLATALATRMHAGVHMVIAQLAFLAHGRADLSAARRYAHARAFDFTADFQNDDGSYNAAALTTSLAACAFTAHGTPEAKRRAKLAAGWLARRVMPDSGGGAWVPDFGLPTWSTVHYLRALLHAGASAADPRVERATTWLLDTQHHRLQSRVNQRDPRATRAGGWAYDPGNHKMPDCDDTGAVLSVLAMVRAGSAAGSPLRVRIEAAAARATDWLAAMHNDDGGWSAYVKGLPGKAPGPMSCEPIGLSSRPADVARLLLTPIPALGDPSTEDVTARVLHGLGGFGATRASADVRRALAFLRHQQCEDGSFWGRWLMNHLAGSAYALHAAQAVGEPLDAPWVTRAAAWVLSRQNADGSWGETPESYRDPSLAGRGEGMAPLTGLVVTSLCAIGLRHHRAVERAVGYLLARQLPDGKWPDDGYVVPILPPDTYYTHPESALYYPLEALARFVGSEHA
jgi:squalene cyclase